ncbi:DUF7269 family protein [Halosimplex sp. J119]
MKRVLTAIAALIGVVAIAAALALAVVLTPVTASDAGVGAVLVALVGGILVIAKLYRPADDEDVAPAPWTDEGALVAGRPEETADPADVTGAEFAKTVDEACDRAASSDAVEDGFEVVRPPLREVLTRVLVASGTDRDAVQDALAAGEWTSDPVAAAVVDERVDPPQRSLRERIRAWLFPERVVRRRTARAVGAIAETAEAELPPVAGQRAPRTLPTLAPALGSLQRSVDGTLQEASTPPTAGSAGDSDDGGSAGSETDGGAAGTGDSASDTDTGSPGSDAAEAVASTDDSDVTDLVEEVWEDA